MNLAHLPMLIEVPAVSFLMGTLEHDLSSLAKAYGGTRESYREESPQHQVTLSAYAIAQTPVTNALYAAYVAACNARAPIHWRGAQPPERLYNHPVVDVSWDEARAFCRWLDALHLTNSDVQFLTSASSNPHCQSATVHWRLPTEAEWEHAARGTDARRFPWGNAWADAFANTRERGLGETTPVDIHPHGASPYHCLDMGGNIWEWTSSLDKPYPFSAQDGRENVATPGRRILRGGCYANPQGFARCACRFRLAPTVQNAFLGFRLVCVATTA